jgi:hypothetical protein
MELELTIKNAIKNTIQHVIEKEIEKNTEIIRQKLRNHYNQLADEITLLIIKDYDYTVNKENFTIHVKKQG